MGRDNDPGVLSVRKGFALGNADVKRIPRFSQDAEDGHNLVKVARATFDPSANTGERTVAAHGLGVFIPDNAIILGGFYDVITTFTSAADTATIALSTEGANDIVAAVAIGTGTPFDAGRRDIVPDGTGLNSVKMDTAAGNEIVATVAVQALTAGKMHIYLVYMTGE